MQSLYLVLMAILSFGGLVVSYKIFKKDCLFVFAIGSVIAANIYNIGSYGLQVGWFILGIDSVLYTLFVFCTLLMYFIYGKKEANKLMWTAVSSIMFTALIDFVANCSKTGLQSNVIWGFASYLISALATIFAIYFMIKVCEYLKKSSANNYIQIIVGLLVASLVNSLIYFGLISILTLSIQSNFMPMLIGSYIGKIMTIGFSLVAYWIVFSIIKKDEIKIKSK